MTYGYIIYTYGHLTGFYGWTFRTNIDLQWQICGWEHDDKTSGWNCVFAEHPDNFQTKRCCLKPQMELRTASVRTMRTGGPETKAGGRYPSFHPTWWVGNAEQWLEVLRVKSSTRGFSMWKITKVNTVLIQLMAFSCDFQKWDEIGL